MKKQQIIIFSILLVLILLSNLCTRSTFAQVPRFQSILSKDCSVYESLYKGLKCRNATASDTPVCENDEDILNSPRRLKLCCCTRLQESEEEEDITDTVNKQPEACNYIGCSRAKIKKQDGEISESTCPKGVFIVEIDDPSSACCCPEKVDTKGFSTCRLLGCGDPLTLSEHPTATFGTCPQGLLFKQIRIETRPQRNQEVVLSSSTHNCCCPKDTFGNSKFSCENAEPNCSRVGPGFPGGGPGASCLSGFDVTTTKVDILNEGTSISSFIPICCCATSSSP